MNQETIYKNLPNVLQNGLITLFDYLQYSKRHGEKYHAFKAFLKAKEFQSREELEQLQNEALVKFLEHCKQESPYFREVLSNIDVSKGIEILNSIPICSKEEFRKNIPNIIAGNKKQMYKSKTGGTTGKAMQVYFRWDDLEERFAILDYFRERFGYKFGEKTAWFSGKDMLTKRDLAKNRFWKQDWKYNIRYYSTFNISEFSLIHYINDLKKYKPAFIVGFPSSIVEIARYALRNNIKLGYKVKAIFPTAESKVESEAKDLEKFFGGGVYDQYASSEGACFITECDQGNLHFEMLSGIIEIVDEDNNPSQEGRMLITAFHTRGTPLLRYDIGDSMKWSDLTNCSCGRKTPIVEVIHGRVNDYIFSKERGKCNLGNISNCIKHVKGVRRFQVVQNEIDTIQVLVENDVEYDDQDEKKFLDELRFRLGDKINIEFKYLKEIPREKSGKFRIVKNSIKNLKELQ